jgi:uncharacterized membrane protein
MVGMGDLNTMWLMALITGNSLVLLALVIIGWLYWLHLRDKREQDSPERQRERLRREYWAQVKS